ncbi:MAG: arsenate reductase [Candidatus Latescibacterota bacterium]|jgi:arsenate reductase
MKKIYHLATCDTCKRIMKELNLPSGFESQEIKNEEITVKQLEEMYTLSGSYEALFSKRAKRYKERGLKDKNLQEQDFKQLILEHYTFLKRPVFLYNSQLFIGNSKNTVAAAKAAIHRQ